ncbi:MAG: FAD-dependent oxidoreductase [Candidatus Obscuribacter sp.]|nr:FAD-dependent oxidoreductase [Candidatus Obscuribacter sp.]
MGITKWDPWQITYGGKMSDRIVIVGGGFAGVKCARTLRKLLPDNCDIVLFNRENHMVFHPLLAEVVSATVQPKDVGAPLRQLLKGVQCRTEDVTNIVPDSRQIFYEAHDGQVRPMDFSHLVLTCGNTVNLSLVPGMDEHAFPLKTIGDALALQAHVMEQLEKAEVCENPEKKKWYLTFIVVGGGFSGVEVAGEINDLVRKSRKYFHHIKEEDIKVVIVHSKDALLPEVGESLRQFARVEMEKAGVTVMLKATAAMATNEGLRLNDGTLIRGGTVVCTIGTTTTPLIGKINLPKQYGRLITEPDMSLPGLPSIWALGDCAAVVNAQDGKFCPPVAQFAERQGAQVAQNIARRIKGQATKPFSFKMQGQLCAIGGKSAVAEILGIRLSGGLAWFMWRGIYLMKLPSWPQKIKVGLEWGLDLLFGRTLAHLKADRTKRICRAHYGAGDYIFLQGDPATDFYVIDKGEVEILSTSGEGKAEEEEEVIAILGPGDFFGESSLLDRAMRTRSVRARSEVTCMVLGRNVFTQISSCLIPLKEAVAKAAQRRSNMWLHVPDVRLILEDQKISSMIEPLPMPSVPVTQSVENVIAMMHESNADACYIVDKDGMLAGIITRSNLLAALEKAPLADPNEDLPVSEIMILNPVCLATDEGLAAAVATMRDHDLKQLPIVNDKIKRVPIGRLRIEKIVSYVLRQMLERKRNQTASSTDNPITSQEDLERAIAKARSSPEYASRKTLEI